MNAEIELLLEKIRLEKDIIAKAKMIHSLKYDFEMRGTEIAKRLQIQQSYISNVLRILKVPDLIQDGYYSKIITATHLLLISRLKEEDMTALFEHILTNNLTIQQTEEYVREKLSSIKTDGSKLSQEMLEKFKTRIKEYDQDLSIDVIQTQVQAKILIKIKGNRKKTSEALEKIIEKLL